MAFDKIPPVPEADRILQQAFAAARGKRVRGKRLDSPLDRERKKQRERLSAMTSDVAGRLRRFSHVFPSVDDLSEFYRQLIGLRFDLDEYRVCLARIHKSAPIMSKLARKFRGRIEAAGSAADVRGVVKELHGRIASVLHRLDGAFAYLEKVRLHLRDLPTMKQRFTVCIAGFPNVGKTTLFCELTGSNAEVNSYAFTTKRLNVDSARLGYQHVQFVDTPGTLNRDHMNDIELQADYALKYVADIILYVYDPTHTYSLEKQDALRKQLDSYKVPVYNYLSKKDLVDDDVVDRFAKERGTISKESFLEIVQDLLAKR